MPLTLGPMDETDLEAYTRVFCASFDHGNGFFKPMFPNGYREEDIKMMAAIAKRDFRESNVHYFMKIMDTDLPDDDPNRKIVSVAHWRIYPTERRDEEIAAEEAVSDKWFEENGTIPNANMDFLADFGKATKAEKRKVLGNKPYVFLQMLATHPDHHRRGTGGIHLDWGLRKADELGIPAYLESSRMGAMLYERKGFKQVKPLPFDFGEYVNDGEKFTHVCMLRPAQVSSRASA